MYVYIYIYIHIHIYTLYVYCIYIYIYWVIHRHPSRMDSGHTSHHKSLRDNRCLT